MSTPTASDTIYSVIRELETTHTYCLNKTKFLDNVLLGTETITFQVVDRCRETLMQINQANHVFATKLEKYRDASAMQNQLKPTCDSQLALVAHANDAVFTIQNWLPPGLTQSRSER